MTPPPLGVRFYRTQCGIVRFLSIRSGTARIGVSSLIDIGLRIGTQGKVWQSRGRELSGVANRESNARYAFPGAAQRHRRGRDDSIHWLTFRFQTASRTTAMVSVTLKRKYGTQSERKAVGAGTALVNTPVNTRKPGHRPYQRNHRQDKSSPAPAETPKLRDPAVCPAVRRFLVPRTGAVAGAGSVRGPVSKDRFGWPPGTLQRGRSASVRRARPQICCARCALLSAANSGRVQDRIAMGGLRLSGPEQDMTRGPAARDGRREESTKRSRPIPVEDIRRRHQTSKPR